jgi:hypothetical protein
MYNNIHIYTHVKKCGTLNEYCIHTYTYIHTYIHIHIYPYICTAVEIGGYFFKMTPVAQLYIVTTPLLSPMYIYRCAYITSRILYINVYIYILYTYICNDYLWWTFFPYRIYTYIYIYIYKYKYFCTYTYTYIHIYIRYSPMITFLSLSSSTAVVMSILKLEDKTCK